MRVHAGHRRSEKGQWKEAQPSAKAAAKSGQRGWGLLSTF